jgi:predicted dithiol-disulfide oxidoreductase (DUF899 family)
MKVQMELPPVVSESEWQAPLDALRVKEKELTRAQDALAAERRRLPRLRIEKDYVFDGPDGKARLVDLFEGRRQLIVYHFMFGPNQDAGCDGCSLFADQVTHLAHLHARHTSFAFASRAPIEKSRRTESGWAGRSRGTRPKGGDVPLALGLNAQSGHAEHVLICSGNRFRLTRRRAFR